MTQKWWDKKPPQHFFFSSFLLTDNKILLIPDLHLVFFDGLHCFSYKNNNLFVQLRRDVALSCTRRCSMCDAMHVYYSVPCSIQLVKYQ